MKSIFCVVCVCVCVLLLSVSDAIVLYIEGCMQSKQQERYKLIRGLCLGIPWNCKKLCWRNFLHGVEDAPLK